MQRNRWCFLIAVLLSVVIVPVPGYAQTGKVWALLIGVSKYANPQISSLRFPAADATGIRDALLDKELGGLPDANVRLLTDEQATSVNILGAVDTFLKPNVKSGDKVVLFLAGHGVAKGVGLDAKSFLLSSNVKGLTTAALEESAVNLRMLSDKLAQLPASQFIVFVDACREDPTPGRGVKGNPMSDVLSRGALITPQESTHPASSVSFFACSIGQRAFEDPAFNHGVFTYWILEGIRTAAAAKKPDGAIDMGVLSSYVKTKVAAWAKQASEKGDFEIEQTPDFVAGEVSTPVILMRVKKPLPETAATANTPQVTILSETPGAQVTLDGERIGAAPLTHSLPNSGKHTLTVEAPGYTTIERQLTALDGYDLLLTISPPPGARSAAVATQTVPDYFKRAVDAERQQQWEVAEAGYTATLQSDPLYVPAYERLADLRKRRGKIRPSLDTLTQMVSKTPGTAHGFSMLALAYSELSLQEAPLRGTGSGEKPKEKKKGGLLGGLLKKEDKEPKEKPEDFSGGPDSYIVPKNWKEAAILARRAANEAVKLDPNSAEANRALGFALVVTDVSGKNKDDAMAAFGKSLLFDAKDATNHYGMGYGIRFFSVNIKDTSERNTELERATNEFKEALNLRPDYYEAHRELAYCYHLMEKTPEAEHEYEAANANRGSANNGDEVAALNLSLVSLYREQANGASGDKKAELLAAADGYFGDAKEITPNLEAAMRILTNAQLSTRIVNFMPPELQKFLDLPDELRRQLKLPTLSLPKFP